MRERTRLARDVEKEQSMIRNGNRYVREQEGTGVFVRDVDRLYVQYTNLRHKVYNSYKDNFSDEATQQELKSYIDEQFVKLTKEYEINGDIDFPGYIKRMLNQRVRGTFLKNKFRDNNRERLGKEENEVELLMGYSSEIDPDVAFRELVEEVFSDVHLSDIERAILNLWINTDLKDREVIIQVTSEQAISVQAVQLAMKELRIFVMAKLNT